jgi:predicted enzyme related to lactoylglutathione lyase
VDIKSAAASYLAQRACRRNLITWQRKDSAMSRVVHFELPVDDPDRAANFYRSVFGWQINKWEGELDYWLVRTGKAGDMGIDGALTKRSEGFMHTVNTVGVESLDESIARVEAHGGKILMPKNHIPGVGWLAYAQDTEGNNFGIIQPDPMPG